MTLEWISVKDKLPEYGVDVLVFKTYHNTIEIACRKSTDEIGENWNISYGHYIIYWMPLPEPPKQSKYEN